MKRIIASLAICTLCAAGALGIVGCTSEPSSNTSTNATSSTAVATDSGEAERGTGPLDRATEFITDDGVTDLDYAEFQTAADKVNFNMTLAEVQDIMGAKGTALTDSLYEANTYGWYTKDKAEAFIAVFDSESKSGKLISCVATVE